MIFGRFWTKITVKSKIYPMLLKNGKILQIFEISKFDLWPIIRQVDQLYPKFSQNFFLSHKTKNLRFYSKKYPQKNRRFFGGRIKKRSYNYKVSWAGSDLITLHVDHFVSFITISFWVRYSTAFERLF